MSGGGGGDGGASARAAAEEQRKAQARSRLNYLFGEESPVDRSQYTRTEYVESPYPNAPGVRRPVQVFDQAGYDAAVAAQKNNPNRIARDALYQTIRDNAFDAGKRTLDENREKAARNNKFALFAQGLNGGSEDIDQNAQLQRTYDSGLLDLGAKADAAKANFQTNDENTRLGLLQSIDAGMDQTSAISSAINQMKNNADTAAANAAGTALDDLFATSGLLYTRSQAAQGKQAATDWWNNLTSGSGGGRTSQAARTGLVTPT